MTIPFMPMLSRRFTIPQKHLLSMHDILLEYDVCYAVQYINEQKNSLIIQVSINPFIAGQQEVITLLENLINGNVPAA